MTMYLYEICKVCGRIMSTQTTTGVAGTTESKSYRSSKRPCGACGTRDTRGRKVDKRQEER